MTRRFCIALALIIGTALPAAAQGAALDSTARALVGTWEGNYESDHAPPGPMRLIVARDSVWKVKMVVSFQGQEMESIGSNFKVDGNNLSWTETLMGMPCKASAVLTAGTLRGETTCDQGGIGYLLHKK